MLSPSSSLLSSLPPENGKPTTSEKINGGPLAVARIFYKLFSTVQQERSPPLSSPNNNKKTIHIRLITIAPSHYCEKVRWVLDMLEENPESPYYYTEDAHPPGFHAFETTVVSKEQSSITPMIVLSNKQEKQEVLYDSTTILKRFMPSLYPTEIQDKVEKMENYLDKTLGPSIRCHAYYHFFRNTNEQEQHHHKASVQLCADEEKVSKVESILFDKMLSRGLSKGILQALEINDDTAKASLEAIRNVFQTVDKILENNDNDDDNDSYYLMDHIVKKEKNDDGKTSSSSRYGFTAADLTLAALAYPYLRPKEMSFWLLKNDEDYPKEILALSKELALTRTGQHVLKMYQKHRLPSMTMTDSSANNVVVMKKSNRNKYAWEEMPFLGRTISILVVVGAATTATALSLYMILS